jgi:hypothetical protein
VIDPVSGERLSDERLCWLAVRDQLWRGSDASTARTGFGEIVTSIGRLFHRILMPGEAADMRSDRMARMSLVVDDLAARLSPAERQVLRETGAAPDWFLPTVHATYVERYR